MAFAQIKTFMCPSDNVDQDPPAVGANGGIGISGWGGKTGTDNLG